MKKISIGLIYTFIIIYLETIFRITTSSTFNITLLHSVIYILFISTILGIISCLLKSKTNKIIINIILLLLSTLYVSHILFFNKFDVFLSINAIGLSDQLLSFSQDLLKTILNHWYVLILCYIPSILFIAMYKSYEVQKSDKRINIIYGVFSLVLLIIFNLTILINKEDTYSAYNLYKNINNTSLSIEKLGVLPTTLVETKRFFFKIEEKLIIDKEEQEEVITEYGYNTLDINFEELTEHTTNKNIINMNEYFEVDTGTKKNEYTGYFEGKNLILIMAESFTHVAVSEELTPTIYKLTNEGFVFENFYSPVILSTIGGEFQELTGLYPNLNLLSSVWRKGTNYFPYGYGNLFQDLNYNTYAYHNNQYNFQNRDKYLESLGFDNYQGCYNGLEERINCNIWPQSDQEMITATTEDYINNEPFMTYYVTVSGHMAYTWGNAMSKKHKELVNDLDYSEEVKAYIATQIELDKALENLIKELEEKDVLDNTVIAMISDHYPYGLELEHINEMAETPRDKTVEINRNSFILWNNQMEPIKIDKVGSQIDVLPTILNLFNIEYDSRLIIGKDILSDEPGLAIFGNNSWVSDYGTYYSSSNNFVPTKTEIPENYVNDMNIDVYNKILMSKYIIEYDYYDFVFNTSQ